MDNPVNGALNGRGAWRKSSYFSDPHGGVCVEAAIGPLRAFRDSKQGGEDNVMALDRTAFADVIARIKRNELDLAVLPTA